MGWLYSRNVPALAQMMLQEFPVLREDDGMMRGYMFLIDFLEAVAKETSGLLQKNQRLLRIILEAAKINEDELNEQIQKHSDEVRYLHPARIPIPLHCCITAASSRFHGVS